MREVIAIADLFMDLTNTASSGPDSKGYILYDSIYMIFYNG